MVDHEQKAIDLMSQADKKLKSAGGFFGSFFGWGIRLLGSGPAHSTSRIVSHGGVAGNFARMKEGSGTSPPAGFRGSVPSGVWGVWLKSPPTVPTPPTIIISSPYQLNKQVEQSGEFINIKWMFTHIWNSFEWSSKLVCKLWGEDSNLLLTLVRLWSVQGTNYSRWCRWWPVKPGSEVKQFNNNNNNNIWQ